MRRSVVVPASEWRYLEVRFENVDERYLEKGNVPFFALSLERSS